MHAHPVRAEQAAEQRAACNDAECRFSRAEQTTVDERTGESRRAEDAFRKVAAKQRAKADRLKFAAVLLASLERHDVSRSRLAMMVDVTEKQVRKVLGGERAFPPDWLLRMPTELRFDVLDGLNELCGATATASADRVLERLRRENDIDGTHDLEDRARTLSRDMTRGR